MGKRSTNQTNTQKKKKARTSLFGSNIFGFPSDPSPLFGEDGFGGGFFGDYYEDEPFVPPLKDKYPLVSGDIKKLKEEIEEMKEILKENGVDYNDDMDDRELEELCEELDLDNSDDEDYAAGVS